MPGQPWSPGADGIPKIPEFIEHFVDKPDWKGQSNADDRKFQVVKWIWPDHEIAASKERAIECQGAWSKAGQVVTACNILKYMYEGWVAGGNKMVSPAEVTARVAAHAIKRNEGTTAEVAAQKAARNTLRNPPATGTA